MLAVAQYLLEHWGADIGNKIRDTARRVGETVWDLLGKYLIEDGWDPVDDDARVPDKYGEMPYAYDATVVTSLLRVMALRAAPPAEVTARLSPESAQVVANSARLKVALPAYLAQRRALLDAHCPLISPLPEELQALIFRFEGSATTDELWATGLGAARRRAVRPRADDGAVDAAVPLRRSLCLRQKRE
jgi:hypothetical protein